MNRTLITLSLLLLLASSCNDRYHIDTSHIKDNVRFISFWQEIGSASTPSKTPDIETLQKAHPDFFDIYTRGILRLGSFKNNAFDAYFQQFLKDSLYNEVFDTVSIYSGKLTQHNAAINSALKKYVALFNGNLPTVYYMISVFNEPIVASHTSLGISLEQYLGAKHPYYNELGIYQYLKPSHANHRLPIDAVKGWIQSDFTPETGQQNVLDVMIYHGKICFLLEKIMPELHLEDILNVSKEQANWSLMNEKNIWNSMIGWKHLYKSDRITLQKHIGEAPYSSFFGEKSSPKTGVFIGYKIVESYMKVNKKITLQMLMQDNDAQKILQKSKYRP